MKISKVLNEGDIVYSAANGQPIRVTWVYSCGFDSEQGYFSYDEHRSLFWLTKKGYSDSIRGGKNAKN
jgi:hypothetical protein